MELLGKATAAALALAALALAAAALSAFPIMLGLGAAHHEISGKIPALGFWATLIIGWGIGSLAGLVRGGNAKVESK